MKFRTHKRTLAGFEVGATYLANWTGQNDNKIKILGDRGSDGKYYSNYLEDRKTVVFAEIVEENNNGLNRLGGRVWVSKCYTKERVVS
jgi:hypothetical protein